MLCGRLTHAFPRHDGAHAWSRGFLQQPSVPVHLDGVVNVPVPVVNSRPLRGHKGESTARQCRMAQIIFT